MKRFIALALAVVAVFSLASCGAATPLTVVTGDGTANTTAGTPEDTGNTYYLQVPEGISLLSAPVFSSTRKIERITDNFKRQYASFSLELLKRAGNGKAALVSPLSVLCAMLMTANGARGETLDELEKVLCGDLNVEETNAQLFSFFESLGNSADAKFESANSVWVTDAPDFHVSGDYIKLVENTFRADIYSAPFPDASTVDAINRWCAVHTADMIKKILNYDDVSRDTVMVLLNALYFDAVWSEQYQPHSVSEAVFHGLSGDKKVTMMYSTEYRYIEGEHETGFVKYYAGSKYAFVALLPDSGTDIADYVASLDGERFVSLCKTKSTQVRCGLPKFSFDWSGSLVDVLCGMGISRVFTEASDLSGLGYCDGGEALAVSNVIHKTHIDVDESGTRAAAVTAVIVNRVTSVGPEPDPKKVILDRPFVYAIVDAATMLPVFIGFQTDIG